MINLLFISNSPRAELLRVHFQQILKIRIEVVEDFDRGLKDVFEKRPVVVCIQEQIAGVTGESVARHIQLLLGNGAPGFILMHEGSVKAKILPGLFDRLVDLSAPFEVVRQTLHLALQAQLGELWDKVYTPPLQEVPVPEITATTSVADQLIDEFISEISIFHPQNAPPLPNHESYTAEESLFVHDLPGGPPAEPDAARSEPVLPPGPVDVAPPPVSPTPLPVQKPVSNIPKQQVVIPEPERPVRQMPQTPAVPPAAAAAEKTAVLDEASVPVDELLQAFEENYHRNKRLKLRVALAVVALLVILTLVWGVQQGRFKKLFSAPVKQSQIVTPLQIPKVQTAVSSVKAPAQVAVSKPDVPPSFIPKAGYDAAFSGKNPGWSRFLTERRDYRLFKTEGRLRALQVLAVGNGSIAPAELQQILHELTGTGHYRTDSRESRGGLRLERATVPKRAELLIYRSLNNGAIKAFVLQLTP
jgi:hypothetical protein